MRFCPPQIDSREQWATQGTTRTANPLPDDELKAKRRPGARSHARTKLSASSARKLPSMFIIVALVLLLVLPVPWNVVGFAVGLICFGGEVVFWNRTVRRHQAATGADTLIGKTGTTVTDCRPDGQVRLGGEIWKARCDEGADKDAAVIVTGRKGLTLVVARGVSGS